MSDRHYKIERTMTKPSAGGTVTPTTTGESSRLYKNNYVDNDEICKRRNSVSRTESKSVMRKRRRTEPTSPKTGIPRKTPRWTGEKQIPERPPDERASEDVPEDIQRDVKNESSNISSLFSSSFDDEAFDNAQDFEKNYMTDISSQLQKKINDEDDEKDNFHVENEKEEKMSINTNFCQNKINCRFETIEGESKNIPEEIQHDVKNKSSNISSLYYSSFDNEAFDNAQDFEKNYMTDISSELQKKINDEDDEKDNFHVENETKEKMSINTNFCQNQINCGLKTIEGESENIPEEIQRDLQNESEENYKTDISFQIEKKINDDIDEKDNFHVEEIKEENILMNFHENKNNFGVKTNECTSEDVLEEFQGKVRKINDAVDRKCDNFVEDEKEEKISTSNIISENNNNNNNNSEVETETEVEMVSRKPPIHPDVPRKRVMGLANINRRDESSRLRKTIQWLEDGARKLREDLAEARAELHEERKASRLARREIEVAVREARANETAKHQRVIAELKTRLSQSPSRSTTELCSASTKAELLKDENHRREISAVKKRLAEADATIRKLKSNSLDSVSDGGSGKRRKIEATSSSELRKLDGEVKALRAANKKLEDKLNMVCIEAEKIRSMEMRIQHENHESELNALKKSLRSDTIRMMDEIKNKDREIERLGRLARENRKSMTRTKDDDTMRKLRENENGHQIRLAARIEDKIPQVENEIDLFKREFEEVSEVERLRELAIEQQEFIDVLRQAVKEKERKLDQLSKKKKKEEFYKQWLELEPVAEVDDEEEHEEGDSALSSAPSSLSPQPGGCGSWQTNSVTREAYEAVLLEIDEIQTKFLEEQQELVHAKSQVRDLEKALLQETRGSQNSRRALSEKLRKFEEREAALLAEISELRDQNELLEFRVLELEESPGSRETPENADSGIVSPEPINIFKQEQNNKQRDRAVATVLPFSSYTHPASPLPVKKPPLSLQESGIFEDDEEDLDDVMESEQNHAIELTSCGTQTEAPVGELLQEVQRLHELRERIQERAVKVPQNPTTESIDSKIEEDKSLYREKIRQLEERLAQRDEKDAERIENDFVVKQREEDLLDENYRLTERVYWLENELRNAEKQEKILIDVEIMTDNKTSSIDKETMTESPKIFLDASTITEIEKNTSDVGTMTKNFFSPKYINEECLEIDEINHQVSNEISPISRCEKIYENVLRNNLIDEQTLKMSIMEIDEFAIEQKLREPRKNKNNVQDCNDCVLLRKDYDEKIEKLTKAECRFRGRLVDIEKKEGAFVDTLKQVDVTWSQLEIDHAKKLEEIGRRLEEKVECNRRIMERVAQLEMIKNREDNDKTCSCKCKKNSLTSGDISLVISSADEKKCEMRDVDFSEIDETDYSMDVDVEECDEESKKTTKFIREVDKTTQTDENGSECLNCKTKRERIFDKKTKSLRRFCESQMGINDVEIPTVDFSTEIAIEAKEDIVDEKSTFRAEIDNGISRVHLLPEDERPEPEPTENLHVTINETEIDKKVRHNKRGIDERVGWEGEGWVQKNWNMKNFSLKGESDQVHETDPKICTIFRHGGLQYVIYPEICV